MAPYGRAAPLSCWSTARDAVPPAVVRVMGAYWGGHRPPGTVARQLHALLGTTARPAAATAGRVSPAVMGHWRRGQCHLRGHNGPK